LAAAIKASVDLFKRKKAQLKQGPQESAKITPKEKYIHMLLESVAERINVDEVLKRLDQEMSRNTMHPYQRYHWSFTSGLDI
jgi:hypothetical protein